MNPDKISNDETVEINLQPSPYFSLTWQGSRSCLGKGRQGVCKQGNRATKEGGGALKAKAELGRIPLTEQVAPRNGWLEEVKIQK